MANKYIIGSLLFLNSARIKLFKRHITIENRIKVLDYILPINNNVKESEKYNVS